ncbi:MAG: ATP-binding protein [Arcicella sp.]|jgi:AAA15 family ATPase/GTPase|nr:ATP-binding protein [Arcicella sp.]
MILKALKYGSPNWSIVSGVTHDDFVAFENINLIVGRNASGKTRFIDALRWISDILDNESYVVNFAIISTFFELKFTDKKSVITYNLSFDNGSHIVDENFSIDGNVKLDRKNQKLFYEDIQKYLSFDTNEKYLGISRKDSLQQPFFKKLQTWGENLSHYSFGGSMGKEQSIGYIENSDRIKFKNFNKVNVVFNEGKYQFGNIFEKNIINDMKSIDYFFDSISLDTASSYLFLKVQEHDLKSPTYFENMSQGMARAFSLLVQLNYSLMAKIPSCILIDDIGEGLDYERSKSLIELIIKKVEGSNIQLFMTTNDRFVMNSVPLKYWSVIHREGNKSVFYNYQNSKQTFDDFAFTGLNNFDFFATDFYRMGFEEFITQ